MKRREAQLPQGYLSNSQVELWIKNPAAYRQIYFERRMELRDSNSAMNYGKVVADALEHGIETGDVLTDSAMLMLPKYDVADKEIRTVIRAKEFDVPILIKPDSLDSATKNFYEYKTGKVPWTQYKAQKHPQLRFYAMGIYCEYNVLLHGCKLIWIETEKLENDIIKPTGKVQTFNVTFTLQDILDTITRTVRVAKEIENEFIAYQPSPLLGWTMENVKH